MGGSIFRPPRFPVARTHPNIALGRYSAGMDARGRAAAWDLEQQPECVADVPFEIKEELAEGHVEPDRPPGERGLTADATASVAPRPRPGSWSTSSRRRTAATGDPCPSPATSRRSPCARSSTTRSSAAPRAPTSTSAAPPRSRAPSSSRRTATSGRSCPSASRPTPTSGPTPSPAASRPRTTATPTPTPGPRPSSTPWSGCPWRCAACAPRSPAASAAPGPTPASATTPCSPASGPTFPGSCWRSTRRCRPRTASCRCGTSGSAARSSTSTGRPCRVTAVYDDVPQRAYRLTFNDGTEVLAGGEHQWVTLTSGQVIGYLRRDRPRDRHRGPKPTAFPRDWAARWGSVRTTDELAATLRTPRGGYVHNIPLAAPLDLAPRRLRSTRTSSAPGSATVGRATPSCGPVSGTPGTSSAGSRRPATASAPADAARGRPLAAARPRTRPAPARRPWRQARPGGLPLRVGGPAAGVAAGAHGHRRVRRPGRRGRVLLDP